MLNKLLEGLEGKLHSSKLANMVKCSKDSEIRDINDLIEMNILKNEEAVGRSKNMKQLV